MEITKIDVYKLGINLKFHAPPALEYWFKILKAMLQSSKLLALFEIGRQGCWANAMEKDKGPG